MRRRKRQSLFLVLLILGIGIPGLMGIFAVQAQVAEHQSASLIRFLQSGLTSTPSAFPTDSPLPSQTPTGLPSTGISPSATVYAFIQAPSGYVQSPFVLLTAFGSIARAESVFLRGYINSNEFVCNASPCAVTLDGASRIVFRAFTSSGASSDEVIASVSVASDANGYLITIDSVSQYSSFVDSCAVMWGLYDEEGARWDTFVQFPYQLNTKKTLHTLVRNLILNGVVDASSCEYGGLSSGLDWPTGCGLEVSNNAMIEWQNQFDDYIWLASKDLGIPPKVLKTLIEFESQFWPGNSRFYLDEFGLGQINQLGVDVLLRRDPSVYQKICPTVLSECTTPYVSLEPAKQALIRGALVQSVDATCPTCENGLDLKKAKDSISLIAKLLRANCRQVDEILRVPYKPDDDADAATATVVAATVQAGGTRPGANYEDYWRFTLLSYHTGISCFNTAVQNTRGAGLPVTWENLEPNLECKSGGPYVNGVFDNLFVFDTYVYQADEAAKVSVAPTIIPTRTPIPTPTVYISNAVIKVQVYVDRNANGAPDDDEWIDGMSVLLATTGNDQITKRTENGLAVFDMTGYRPGLGIDVSLPGLYRSENFTLPQFGEVVIVFKFDQPSLPTVLP